MICTGTLIRQYRVLQQRTLLLLGSPEYRNNRNGKEFDNVYIWLNIQPFSIAGSRREPASILYKTVAFYGWRGNKDLS